MVQSLDGPSDLAQESADGADSAPAIVDDQVQQATPLTAEIFSANHATNATISYPATTVYKENSLTIAEGTSNRRQPRMVCRIGPMSNG